MLLTGDIERFGMGILEMIELSKEADLIAPEFVINEGFIVIYGDLLLPQKQYLIPYMIPYMIQNLLP